MQSETALAMRAKDCLDFKYPTISLAFLDTFSAMEKVSETIPTRIYFQQEMTQAGNLA
ncbi:MULTISPECIES: hypothetical protein [Maribacter]|uniref:Uncharacterized protein n=1 Tax=Maribacter flavus TaxID=1658664 RepID=A0ABU7IED0_9FLAO|nr:MULTISPECIES: hypothetical protein [Maribacter]MDC6404158.1 hypothetical protein [Maribacter sp. PR66]MEE1971301.1 hypothetical protein [Maribacter flavus]